MDYDQYVRYTIFHSNTKQTKGYMIIHIINAKISRFNRIIELIENVNMHKNNLIQDMNENINKENKGKLTVSVKLSHYYA